MELNVYSNGKIEKTYTSDVHVMTVGVCEDILKFIDIDKIMSVSNDESRLGIEILKIIIKSFDKFKPLIQGIFPITDEEYERVNVADVAKVILEVTNYTINNLFSIGDGNNGKK